MYDHVKNVWTEDHLLPVVRTRFGAAAISNTEGFLFGGQDFDSEHRSEVKLDFE